MNTALPLLLGVVERTAVRFMPSALEIMNTSFNLHLLLAILTGLGKYRPASHEVKRGKWKTRDHARDTMAKRNLHTKLTDLASACLQTRPYHLRSIGW